METKTTSTPAPVRLIALTVACDGVFHTIQTQADNPAQALAEIAASKMLGDAIEYVVTGEWPDVKAKA